MMSSSTRSLALVVAAVFIGAVVAFAEFGPSGLWPWPKPDADIQAEDALLAYATTEFDMYEYEPGTRIELGDLNGHATVADFVCSDLCPFYMVRIVHLDIDNEARCDAAVGAIKAITVPMGIGLFPKAYCFPKVLLDHWDRYESGPLHGKAPQLRDPIAG